ncbi:hypothetical protein SAMN02745191_2085 [Anaerorhabdus furcosa]|uniref:Uncharacterized protein n=1 Tax=Anaerorhabdus furcosa TaxID=118967 RepID=A0A1T4PKD8_9FIRM|nr:hypothetical protein SAMN02745191_2085 [Anaerorhabdus furcosa]
MKKIFKYLLYEFCISNVLIYITYIDSFGYKKIYSRNVAKALYQSTAYA